MISTRVLVIAACGLGLSACAGTPDWLPSFEMPRATPAQTTLQFESEPAGAEARTSTGQACQTPCSLSVPAAEFTVTFTRQGFQPQTVPVRIEPSTETPDPEFGAPPPRLVPSPVFAELQPVPPPAPPRRRAAPRRTSADPAKPAAAPRPAAVRPAAPTPPPPPPPPPAVAPAAPWPPVPAQR